MRNMASIRWPVSSTLLSRPFIRMDLGYAAAWSVVLIVVLLVFSIVYRVINNSLNGGD